MTGIKNQKTSLVAIAAVLAVSTIAIGSGQIALAQFGYAYKINNTGVNVPTDTDQKQNCQTAGGASPISGSCTASSTDTITQSGGILKK